MPIHAYKNIHPRIAESAYIADSADVIGNVVIGEDSSVWHTSVIRGDLDMTITIGNRTNIQDGSILHVNNESEYVPNGYDLVIGDSVTVGHRCILHACTVEDTALIGMGSTVLDGALVCSGAMIGANSLVPPGKVIEGGYLWLGAPIKRVRKLIDTEKAFLVYSADNYVRLKDEYLCRVSG
ncbi:MAG: gamma carbonic anhydrase family protein [Gammaproteobacteria bacterium]|nr:gamma carbonic anhydrase family protein [Gammaproteobacteria bacterium]